jgi:PKD repeat protein
LSDGWLNETNGQGDDIDWRVDAGGTPSSATGPSGDHTTGSGNYLYLEASAGCEGQWASLVSPCIDLTGVSAPTLSYWYHMYGGDMGELHVDLFDGNTWIEDVVPALAGDQGNAWVQQTYDLSAYSGQTINIRFRGLTGNGFESDLALDDIGIFDLSLPPSPVFSASSTSICVGESVVFTDASGNFPSAWSWSFSPSTVTFVGGTSASSQNPQVVFNALGDYDVTLVVSNGAGPNTLTQTDLVSVGNGSSLPIAEDLESFAACAITTDCGGTECPLGNGWTNAANGIEDDVDWRVDSDGTTSTGTGPDVDANPGTIFGQYIYLETSGSCVGQEGLLISPCLDLTNSISANFRFAYHMYGPAISGDQGNAWFYQDVDLTPYVGYSVRVRVRAITGTSYTSDVALDDFTITDSVAVCEAPTGLMAVPTPTSVSVSWNPVAGAAQYNLQGRLSPSGGWRKRFLAATSLNQSGLNPGTSYDIQVRAQCADGSITDFSDLVTFTTPLSKLGQAPFGESILQPVPASSSVSLRWNADRDAELQLRVLDATGRVVDVQQVRQLAGPNQNDWNVSEWPAGVYTVVLSADGHAPVQHRLTVVH